MYIFTWRNQLISPEYSCFCVFYIFLQFIYQMVFYPHHRVLEVVVDHLQFVQNFWFFWNFIYFCIQSLCSVTFISTVFSRSTRSHSSLNDIVVGVFSGSSHVVINQDEVFENNQSSLLSPNSTSLSFCLCVPIQNPTFMKQFLTITSLIVYHALFANV